MDFITREQARQEIVALRLPPIVLDVFDERPLPYDLDIQFCYPYHIFCLGPEQQAAYGQGRITPLWTDRSSIVAYHHDPAQKGFFRFNIESADLEQPAGLSWQQILVKEFKDLWEAERGELQIREAAGWFEFHYIDDLITELSQAKRNTFESDTVWYRSFLDKVGA